MTRNNYKVKLRNIILKSISELPVKRLQMSDRVSFSVLKQLVNISLLIVLSVILSVSAGCHSKVNSHTTIKVMTYNIHHGQGIDGRLDLDRIAEIIRTENCDIVGLNEVDDNFGSRSDFQDQPRLLAEKLNMHYVYAPAIITPSSGEPGKADKKVPDTKSSDTKKVVGTKMLGTKTPDSVHRHRKARRYGNALLSRFPIKNAVTHKLYQRPEREPRTCLQADIEIAGKDYTFFVTHLDHQINDIRIMQVRDIIKILQKQSGTLRRTILMGDFNCHSADGAVVDVSPVGLVMKMLQDTFLLAGAEHDTSAVTNGNARIDYIFVSPDMADNVKSCRIINNSLTKFASDHFPVAAAIGESAACGKPMQQKNTQKTCP